MYDYYLGGGANCAVDREAARRYASLFPPLHEVARANQGWRVRVVRAAARAGIVQFLDLGAGVLTCTATHAVLATTLDSSALEPSGSGVVYVDHDALVCAYGRLDLEGTERRARVAVVHADYRRPDTIWTDEAVARVLDLSRPVCVLAASVLQFIGPGDDPRAVLEQYMQRLPVGSWLAANHPSVDDAPEHGAQQARDLFAAYTAAGTPVWLRDRDEFASWFAGLNLLEPGVVHATDWRPDNEDMPRTRYDRLSAARPYYWSGVGVKPDRQVNAPTNPGIPARLADPAATRQAGSTP